MIFGLLHVLKRYCKYHVNFGIETCKYKERYCKCCKAKEHRSCK